MQAEGTPLQNTAQTVLRRAITLPLLIFYGLGVTIGAGIYVLVGATAAQAGIYAPASFLVAAVVMLFSAGSFSELSGRFPLSAGEAAYVEAAFKRPSLTVAISGMLAAWGILESVRFAAVLTLVEILGLVIVVAAGIWHQPTIIFALPSVFPEPSDTAALGAIALTSLIAFFAVVPE